MSGRESGERKEGGERASFEKRRGDEDDNTLTEVLVGSVFEGEEGLFDGVGDVGDATELLLCGVDCAEDGAELLGICYEDFWSGERSSG